MYHCQWQDGPLFLLLDVEYARLVNNNRKQDSASKRLPSSSGLVLDGRAPSFWKFSSASNHLLCLMRSQSRVNRRVHMRGWFIVTKVIASKRKISNRHLGHETKIILWAGIKHYMPRGQRFPCRLPCLSLWTGSRDLWCSNGARRSCRTWRR